MRYMSIHSKWHLDVAVERARHLASLGRRPFVVGKINGLWKIVPVQDSDRIKRLHGDCYHIDPSGKVTEYE